MISGNEGSFEIVSFNISEKTGVRKSPVPSVRFVRGQGIEGDAHKGLLEKRQVSLLAVEEVEDASKKLQAVLKEKAERSGGASSSITALKPGDFAENITTRGLALHELPVGTHIRLGSAELEVSQIGKECHLGCEIRTLVGDCAMPRKGIFVRVLKEGEASLEDRAYYRIG